MNERRARLKKLKNDHKLNVSKIKKELDNYNHRLKSGGDESRQKQRSLQLERTIRQTEEATAAIEDQLDSLENVPEEEIQEWKTRKAEYEKELENVKNIKAELDAVRTSSHRSASALDAELVSTTQKRERLQNRRARLTEQYERITAANNQGMNERERRATEQLAKEREHARIEGTFYEQLSTITKSVQDLQMRTTQLSQQASAMEQIYQQEQMLMAAGPLTPEGELPGTNPHPFDTNSSSMAMTTTAPEGRPSLGSTFIPFSGIDNMGFQQTSMSPVLPSSMSMAFDQQQYTSSPLPASSSLFAPSALRGRSMSNFSNHSFDYGIPFSTGEQTDVALHPSTDAAQSQVFAPTPIGHGIAQFNRAGSRGSGSGSGSGSGEGSGSGSPHSTREKPAN